MQPYRTKTHLGDGSAWPKSNPPRSKSFIQNLIEDWSGGWPGTPIMNANSSGFATKNEAQAYARQRSLERAADGTVIFGRRRHPDRSGSAAEYCRNRLAPATEAVRNRQGGGAKDNSQISRAAGPPRAPSTFPFRPGSPSGCPGGLLAVTQVLDR
jgi:hypothetical protein